MQIIKDNFSNNLLEIVNKYAKYQKVMVVYDNSVNNANLLQIYELIGANCVFNKLNMTIEDYSELNNGYKLLIFLCEADSFINFEFDVGEFINVFIPTDNAVLPFFLKGNNFLFLQNKKPDVAIFSSVIFNKVFSFINALIEQTWCEVNFNDLKFITQDALIDLLNKNNLNFIDLTILKQCKIPYNLLPELDFILINAILTLVSSISTNSLGLVDFYKSVKENCGLIDKYYALITNNVLNEVVKLNFSYLLSILREATNKLKIINVNNKNFNKIIKNLKNYLKNCNNFLIYLYLYDIFGY